MHGPAGRRWWRTCTTAASSTEDDLKAIRLQEEELLSWRLVPREELADYLPGALGRRVLAALDVLADGSGRRSWRTATGG